MDATVADWITAGFTVVLALVTGVLAWATARYVTQTRKLVAETKKGRKEAERGRKQSAEESALTREEMRASREEARRSRELSVLPKLAIDMETIAGMFVGLKLTNVGQGPALEVELTITFEPVEGGALPADARPWRAKVLARDEWLRFVPPRDEQGEPLDVPFLGQAYQAVTVRGRMYDALGQEHEVDERVDDLAGLHETTVRAMVLVEKDRVREELRELRKSIDKAASRLLKSRRKRQQQTQRSDVRSRLAGLLGRSSTERTEFEQEKWWGRRP